MSVTSLRSTWDKLALLGVKKTWLWRLERLLGPWLPHLVGVLVLEVAGGVAVGSLASWFGWSKPPSSTFFDTLAPIGAALLVAFAVFAAQVVPRVNSATLKRATEDADASGLTEAETKERNACFAAELRDCFTLPARSMGTVLGGLLGIGTCLAMAEAPLGQSQWWLMALTGVTIVTSGWIGLQIALFIYADSRWQTLPAIDASFDANSPSD